MIFKDARTIEQIVYQMRLADWARGQDRARIDALANGKPPYSDADAVANNIEINVNDLSLTRLAHDGRQQFYNANLKAGNFFTCTTDSGPVHKRQKYGKVVTTELNRIIKRSPEYYECLRSKFALLVLHGIGPSTWDTRDHWCPDTKGIEDVMIPTGTLLTMRNLPMFAVHRCYTAYELIKMAKGPKADRGWNMKMVNQSLRWLEDQAKQLTTSAWNEVWSPEKMEERQKENSGIYASDVMPAIQCWDFYFWNDDDDVCGWNRRIIFDSFSGSGAEKPSIRNEGPRDNFLFNPGKRKYASQLSELINFQFADLSGVAPFRYHSVRSLGFLSYAVCHLQNRLRCKFMEAVFENLMMYMRIKSSDEAERALKIELASRGFIDETVQFLSPDERWQPNVQMAELGMMQNDRIISENSSAYRQQSNYSRDPVVEKTKFQVMAEVNSTTALINAALQQAYFYQAREYQEIFRRFCKENSADTDVREFRARVLKRGVPVKAIVPEAWELEPERVLSPNKSMEMAIANQLMEWRNLYAPESQQIILRQATLAMTDNPGLTELLVPEAPTISHSKEAAMLAVGTLMAGGPVAFAPNHNRIEIVEVLLAEMGIIVQRINQFGGVASQNEIVGLNNMGQTIERLIEFIAADKNERQRVKGYADDLGALMNEVKAFEQRFAEMQKAQMQNGNGHVEAETAAKLQAEQTKAEAKAANMRESHAQKTSQRQVQFEMEQQRKQDEHELEMARELDRQQVENATQGMKAAAEIRRDNAKSKAKPKTE